MDLFIYHVDILDTFMVLINESSKWSYVCLLSINSICYQTIDAISWYQIKKIQLDNANEFTS